MSADVAYTERFELSDFGLIDAWLEVLEYANRPTFVLDLDSDSTAPIHYNKVLRDRDNLRFAVDAQLAVSPQQPRNDFCQWAITGGNEKEGCKFASYDWISTIVCRRWKVIGGIEGILDEQGKISDRFGDSASQDLERDGIGPDGQETYPNIRPSSPPASDWREDADSFDWTNPEPVTNISKHEKFLRTFDWSSTPLGPLKSWSMDLRKRCILLVSDCRPAALYYGDRKTIIYNEAYISVIGNKHPAMLGTPFVEAWDSVADRFHSNFESASKTGKSFLVDNALVNIERSGYLEEAYFSWAVIPTLSTGGVIAYYNPVYEVTRQIISERRIKTLLNLGQSISTVTSLPNFWLSVLDGLRPNVHEVPFCLLYSTSVDSSKETGYTWALEGTIGVKQDPENNPETHPDRADFYSTPKTSGKIQEAFTSGKPTLLQTEDGTLSTKCTDNLIPPRGFGECKSAVILPVIVGTRVLGFLILGISPRRPYDSDYEDWLYVLCRMLATATGSAILFEEEIRRGSETRFRKMADAAPVGMFQIDATGHLLYANEYWYTLTEHPREDSHAMSWLSVIFEEDLPLMLGEWKKLIHDCCHVAFELRLKKPWLTNEMVGTTPIEGDTWILVAAYPEFHSDGARISSVIGCITDISRQKWVEGFQKQRTNQAVEMKRRQENFIDMTSHELRNPMSAILHCADEISSSLSHIDETADDVKFKDLVAEMADAVSTIIHCSEHQKRIIDDILTLSKLESDLLIIAPVDIQPLSVIHTAMKMFEGELHKGDVRMDVIIGASFHRMQIDWARLDSSRLLQIIINLTGNAIKFTRSEHKREIQIIVNASLERPSDGTYGIDYLPPRRHREDKAEGKEWGTGAPFYLHIAIKDTGRGLNPEEKNLMFQRFVQANPRTQVQYGGSGLGLFISKELTERQGGAIGVESEAGVGSTFAFYIKVRRCESPEQPQEFSVIHPLSAHDISAAASDIQVEPNSSPSVPTPPITNSKPAGPKPMLRPSEASRHVLIVEDNLVNQRVLSRQLKNIGCDVHVANHGLEAITFVEKSCFWKSHAGKEGAPLSVILMDLEMPVMTGLECVSRIRDLQKEGSILGHIPVIAVTANARNEQLSGAKDCGMDAVVTKPFRIPELVPEMERLVVEYTGLNTVAGSWPVIFR